MPSQKKGDCELFPKKYVILGCFISLSKSKQELNANPVAPAMHFWKGAAPMSISMFAHGARGSAIFSVCVSVVPWRFNQMYNYACWFASRG